MNSKAIGLKIKRNGKIVISPNKADLINVEVGSLNKEGGLSTAVFRKEKDSSSIPRVYTAIERRQTQATKARNGGYKGNDKVLEEQTIKPKRRKKGK